MQQAFFAGQYFGVVPDIVVLGKGFGAGFPIGAIMISDRLKGFEPDGEELHTFANSSIAQIAAINPRVIVTLGRFSMSVRLILPGCLPNCTIWPSTGPQLLPGEYRSSSATCFP